MGNIAGYSELLYCMGGDGYEPEFRDAEISAVDIIEYKRIYPEEGGAMTGYFAQVREEGIQEGVLKGRLEGHEEGQRSVLVRQLKRRFATEARQYESKVLAASLPEVERWLDNILDAQRIEDVFV